MKLRSVRLAFFGLDNKKTSRRNARFDMRQMFIFSVSDPVYPDLPTALSFFPIHTVHQSEHRIDVPDSAGSSSGPLCST